MKQFFLSFIPGVSNAFQQSWSLERRFIPFKKIEHFSLLINNRDNILVICNCISSIFLQCAGRIPKPRPRRRACEGGSCRGRCSHSRAGRPTKTRLAPGHRTLPTCTMLCSILTSLNRNFEHMPRDPPSIF